MNDRSPHPSPEYLDRIEEKLYTAILADIMDSLGFRNQVMHSGIRPVYSGARMVGRAATMLGVRNEAVPEAPYALELELLDDLKPGELVACGVEGAPDASIWGELLSTCARSRGGRGAITDGMIRDAAAIAAMGFPVFAAGMSPADSKGRCEVVAIREPVEIGGVLVRDGDLVMADMDGCVAVPREIEDEVIAKGLEKVSAENRVRDLLARGDSIRQVFKEYGVL